jgi:hypothetical protein
MTTPATATTPAAPEKQPRRWLKRLAGGAAVLLFLTALFGALGYFWLPGFAKAKLESLLSEQLHRPVTIGAIHVAPYTLEATVNDVKVGNVLRFKSLYVDISAQTLTRRLPVISAVRLVAPELTLTRVASDRLDVSDLLDEWLNKPDDGKPTPAFSVSNIRLEGGRIVWQDKLAQRTDTLSDINIGLPLIANVPAEVENFIRPAFSAKLNGSPLKLTGRARPFAASRDANLQLDLDNLDLTAAVPYLRPYVQLPVDIERLRLSTALDIQFAKVGAGKTALGISGEASFRQFKGSLLDQHAEVGIGALQLKKISVDVLKRQASIGEVTLEQPVLSLLRDGVGSLDFSRLQTSHKPPAQAKADSTAPSTPGKPWQWSIGQVKLDQGQLDYRDTTIAQSLPISLKPLTLVTGPIHSNATHPITLQIKSGLNENGHLDIAGEVAQSGETSLALDISQLDLVALQGWVADQLPVVLTRGNADFKGQFEWRDHIGKTTGDLTLNQINLLDKATSEDLLRWQTLKFSGLEVSTPSAARPLMANLGNIDLKDFFAKVLLTKEGNLNLNQLAAARKKAETADTAQAVKTQPAPASPAVKPPAPGATAAAPSIRIGRITFANGTVDFTDHFIQPNYATQISRLTGHVDPLKAGTLSGVELHGKIERTAPLDITGKIDPLSKPIGLALHATARSIDLSPLSSYSGRYVGYRIEKGKLSAEVDYKIKQGQLEATNHLFLDQLTFGEKVESPDALSIPVTLAVALLRNSRGEIDINLPVSGSINDPKFSLGGIIWKVLGNLLSKAITSPFALLGSLFGGGENLSEISFPAGQILITPDMTPRLQALARALADRPGLKLEVTGTADLDSDPVGFSQATLARKMRHFKQAELASKGKSAGAAEDVSLSPEETTHYLEKVYKTEDIKDKPRNFIGLKKSLPEKDMQTLLLKHFLPTESDLLTLAEDRAQQVQSWLTEQGGVAAERIFLRSAKIEAKKTTADSTQEAATQPAALGGKVLFSLH